MNMPSTKIPSLILGIETSCDDTCAAIVRNGHHVLSNIIASQQNLALGGVVPEVAARDHLQKISQVVMLALSDAKVSFQEIDAIAVTNRPGLASALLVGVAFAKALAFALHIPLIGVHHIEGHIFASRLENPDIPLPYVCLTVSGGHTLLMLVQGHFQYQILGQTTDDAAGEAFDKVARTLGLTFPGGPAIAKLAAQNLHEPIVFPLPMMYSGDENFSFSGIKTAVRYYWESLSQEQKACQLTAIAAGFQQSVVKVLVEKTWRMVQQYNARAVVITGGVAANQELRHQMLCKAQSSAVSVFFPSLPLCTDNAAMIAGLAFYKLQQTCCSDLNLGIQSNVVCKTIVKNGL